MLLDRLQRQAAASGICRMVAETLIANHKMIALARSAGFTVMASREDARLAILERVLLAEQPAAA
jgi:hypothetical protein